MVELLNRLAAIPTQLDHLTGLTTLAIFAIGLNIIATVIAAHRAAKAREAAEGLRAELAAFQGALSIIAKLKT
jgi:ABC-type lipoprotein release transport system permease subunit